MLQPLVTPEINDLTAYFQSDESLRSRSVSRLVLSTTLDIPTPPARLVADWEREITDLLLLEPGDVEALSLNRSRARWPDLKRAVQAIDAWTRSLGLADSLMHSEMALMACRGARYHHDGAQYGAAAFCNLFLSQDKGLDLFFPGTGGRIELRQGSAVIFDTCQPHAVIHRGSNTDFAAADFGPTLDCSLVFLTWELPIEAIALEHLLGISFDTHLATASQLTEAQIWLDGAPVELCPVSGQWRRLQRP